MNNPMHQIAELEAQLTALTTECNILREQRRTPAPELTEVINARLTRMEQNLCEDFVGRFAGNLLPAVELIQARVKTLATDLKIIEETSEKHLQAVKTTLTKTTAGHQALVDKMAELNRKFVELQQKTLGEQIAAVEWCEQAAAATAQSAELCATFASNYESIANTAAADIEKLSANTTINLNKHLAQIKQQYEAAVQPVVERVKMLTVEQLKYRIWMYGIVFFVGLIFSSMVAWVTQPQSWQQQQPCTWLPPR